MYKIKIKIKISLVIEISAIHRSFCVSERILRVCLWWTVQLLGRSLPLSSLHVYYMVFWESISRSNVSGTAIHNWASDNNRVYIWKALGIKIR